MEDTEIDKVAQVNIGVFLVRFHNIENRDKAVEKGVQMFDRKLIVIKPWRPKIEFTQEKMDKAPIWIRLHGLDVEYWEKDALTNIASLVGNPLKADNVTTHKERLSFARILLEIPLNQAYHVVLILENE